MRSVQPKPEGIENPERGFVRWFDDTGDERAIFRGGHRLVFTRFDLERFRDKRLSAAALERISHRLARVERAGLKAIVRFQYSNALDAPDAPLPIVLQHVEQLGGILEQYGPVIAVLQAGFIGAWGEWHSSSNGLDTNKAYRALTRALLDVLPDDRCLQVRTPRHKREVAGLRSLSAGRAFDGSPASRIGLHNDCFLSTEDDSGTYAPPVRSDRRWAASEGLYVPIGGETCRVSPRTEVHLAAAELRELHYSFLSQDWHPDVIAQWDRDGGLALIEMTLGYRLVMTQVDVPERVQAGDMLAVTVRFENVGAAAPINPRPVVLLLEQGTRRIEVPLTKANPRAWYPGRERQVACKVRMPESLVGTWRVSLWLPDASERLRSRPEYSIRFANEATWDPSVGTNVLGWVEIGAVA